MAKKAANGIGAVFGDVVSFFSDTLIGGLSNRINDETDLLLNKVEKRALKLQNIMMQRLAVALIMGAALVSLFLSGMFYLFEFVQITKTLAFLVLGVVLLIIGLYLKNKQTRKGEC